MSVNLAWNLCADVNLSVFLSAVLCCAASAFLEHWSGDEEITFCKGQNFWDLFSSFQLFMFPRSWGASVEIHVSLFSKQNMHIYTVIFCKLSLCVSAMVYTSAFSCWLLGDNAAGEAQPVRLWDLQLWSLVSVLNINICQITSESHSVNRFQSFMEKHAMQLHTPVGYRWSLLLFPLSRIRFPSRMLPSRSRWFLPLGSVANRDAVRKLGKNDELFPLHFSVPGLTLVGSSVVRKSLCYSVPCFAEDPCFPRGWQWCEWQQGEQHTVLHLGREWPDLIVARFLSDPILTSSALFLPAPSEVAPPPSESESPTLTPLDPPPSH